NLAFLKVSTPYVMLINPDVVLSQDAAQAMLGVMRNDREIGIVGSRMFHRGEADEKRFTPQMLFDAAGICYSDWITGALMLIRKSALERVGFFDENIFLFFEETDLCKRFIAAGYKLAVVAAAEVEHTGGASSTQ